MEKIDEIQEFIVEMSKAAPSIIAALNRGEYTNAEEARDALYTEIARNHIQSEQNPG